MAAMTKLPAILARLDDGLDASLDRLSTWLEIPSIGTDPAYNAQTRAAAEWLRADLETLGFKAELRETGAVSYTHLDVYKRQARAPETR